MPNMPYMAYFEDMSYGQNAMYMVTISIKINIKILQLFVVFKFCL